MLPRIVEALLLAGSVWATPLCAHTVTARSIPLPTGMTHTPPPIFSGYLNPAPLNRQFGIDIHNTWGLQVELHPERAILSLVNSQGHAVDNAGRFRFDPCIPYPLSDGAHLYAALPDYWIGFHFDTTGLPADMYVITASLGSSFATLQDGKPIYIDPRYTSPPRISVYVSPHADRLPNLEPGQQFIALERPITSLEAVSFTDANGVSVPSSTLESRVLTLERADATSLQFRVESDNVPLYLPRPADAASIVGLYPLVVDDTVRQLRTRYVGRYVWGYGGINALGGGRAYGSRDALAISSIDRAYGYALTINVGTQAMRNVDLSADFVALDPLVVRFRLHGTVLYWVVADAWGFERSYSLVSMAQAHPEWGAATRAKILNRVVELGMTKDMIAWMFGYPDAYGTIDQVRKLDTWSYDMPAPSAFAMHFRNGVLVKYDPPGQMP
jgi:hypothetical protein